MPEQKRNVRAPKSIEVIRLRPGHFIGQTNNPNHLCHEAIDNFLDELRNNYGDTAGISFSKDGKILVFDNGRGLPIGESIDEESGKKVDSVELIFTKLHSGTKFDIKDDASDSLFGQNGLGLVCICSLSDFVDVKTQNKKEAWHYLFKDGILDLKEKTEDLKYSTQIIFKPSSKYFKSISVEKNIFLERLQLAQAKLPKCKFFFNNKPVVQQNLEDFVRKKLNLEEDTPLFKLNYKTKIKCKDESKPASLEIFLTYESEESLAFGDVNLRLANGSYLNQIQDSIKNILINKIDKKFEKTSKKFLLEGLRLYVSLHHPTPEFNAQVKDELTNDIYDDLIKPIESKLSKILGEHHIISTVESNLSQKLNKKITKVGKKGKISADNKLRDCTNHPGESLYILEGDSAEAVFRDCRDTSKEANLPLRGKILNCETQTLEKIGKNLEIKNIIESIGESPNYRYNYVKIVTDADFDGLHICVLVTLIINKYFPDLVKAGRLKIVLPCLYGAKKGKEFIPIYKVEDTESYKKKGYEIQRFKGLGEMTASQMRHVLDKKIEYTVRLPKTQTQLNKLIKIITDSTEKRKYLEKLEYNFGSFIQEVFNNLEDEKV